MQSLVDRRTPMVLALVFAGVALFLAAIGIYGVLAYQVAQRRREIGIRMALGSDAGGIFRLVLGEGLQLLGIGFLIGVAGAFAIRRALESQLYGIGPMDPVVLMSVACVLGLVALLASTIPSATGGEDRSARCTERGFMTSVQRGFTSEGSYDCSRKPRREPPDRCTPVVNPRREPSSRINSCHFGPSSSMQEASSSIQTGYGSAPRSTTQGVRVDASTLAAAEPRAKRQLDAARVVGGTTDASRGWLYFNLILEEAGIQTSAATAAALAELHDYHSRQNLWEYVPPNVPACA